MKVILAHNYYQQPGGEDRVFESETALLRSRGHEVALFTRHNDAIRARGAVRTAMDAIWSGDSHRALSALAESVRPDIVHFHNTFPLISPAAYYLTADVPIVQTLHNFRPFCASGILHRNIGVCEDCVGRVIRWPAVLHRCYRGSASASLAVATMQLFHDSIGTWQRRVARYIAVSDFTKTKYVQAGFDADRIMVKQNFLERDPGIGRGDGNYAVFVGRLTPEKGLDTLLSAWQTIGAKLRLVIVGDGPHAPMVRAATDANAAIEWLGLRPHGEVLDIVGRAKFLIMPSECYETSGLVGVEAFSLGTPVLASAIGALGELVEDGANGFLFRPGDSLDLVRAVSDALTADSGEMRAAARLEFERKYTAQRNYDLLMQTYREAIAG